MKKEFRKIFAMLFIVVTMAAFFNLKTNALDLTYSGSTSTNNTGATATTSGYTITNDAAKDNICGYRFSVVSSAGTPKSGTKVANVYLSNLDMGNTAYSSGQRFIVSSGVVANKKQLANGTKVKSSTATQSCDYKSGSCGFYSTLAQNPSSMSSWIKSSSSNYLNLQRIYVMCGTNLSNATESDYVLIEPIFWLKLAGTRTAATATELAIYGAAVSGGDEYKGTNGNLYNAGSGTLWNLSNYINREFPNALYVSSNTDVYSAVTIKTSDKYIYKDIISKGYGCSVLTVRNVITIKKVKIAYHPNGGTASNATLNDNGFLVYGGSVYPQEIKHGVSDDPINASTFGLTRAGYQFAGWKVKSTEKVLEQSTEYASTVYAQYNDSSKTTANTTTVYCYLYAVWTPNKVKIAYHPNGGTATEAELNASGFLTLDDEVYFDTLNYGKSDDPYNASTFGLTRTGYQFAGWEVKSTGKLLDENTEYGSTVYAQYNDSSKTTANTTTVYCYLYAKWTANKVKIAYHPNGGTTTNTLNSNGFIIYNNNVYPQTINHGTSDDPINASTLSLTRIGYNFVGWKVRSTGKVLDQDTEYASTNYAQYNDSSKTTSNTTTVYCELFAVWEKKTYTNTVVHWKYVGTGGDNSNGTYKNMGSSTFTGKYGNSVTIPTNLIQTYTGYYNTGKAGSYWNTSTWSHKDIGSTFTQPATAISMQYIYDPKKVTVVFNKNDGTSNTSSQTFTYAVEGNRFGYNNNGTPKWHNNVGQFGGWDREGYTLLGWSETSAATTATYSVYNNVSDSWINTKVANPNSSATVNLYAVWSKNTYTDSIGHWAWGFKGNGNNSNKNAFKLDISSFTKSYGEKFSLTRDLAVTVPNGFYLHDDYGTDSVTGSWASYTYGTEISQKAKRMSFEYDYSPIEYTITYDLDGGTNNSNNPTTYNVLYSKTFSYPTKVGYEFLGWTRQVIGNNLSLTATTSNYRHYTVLNDIEPNTEYRISIGNAKVIAGSATQFSCYIYDFTTETTLARKNVNFGSDLEFSILCPTTADTSHDIRIIFYSGVAGSTSGIATEYTNIEINYELDGINKGCGSVFSSVDQFYSEVAKRTTGNIKLIANWKQTNRITIVPVEPNAPYRENTDVISSFWLVNLNNVDYTQTTGAKVVFSIYNQAGQKIAEEIQNFVCPKNDKNLSFLKWSVPDGYANQTITVKANIIEGTEQYGHIEESFEIESFAICKTPNTSYTDKTPDDFSVPTLTAEDNYNAKWWQWEYTGGAFVKKEYAVGSNISSISLSAPSCPTSYTEDGKLYLKSGYGFECNFNEYLFNVDGYESSSKNHATGNQYQYALFPEFNYEYGIDKSRSFEIDADSGKTAFVNADGMERQHFTPIYYPDGEYNFKIVVSDCWTPAGMLKTYKNVTIYINGNMYEDWYIGR